MSITNRHRDDKWPTIRQRLAAQRDGWAVVEYRSRAASMRFDVRSMWAGRVERGLGYQAEVARIEGLEGGTLGGRAARVLGHQGAGERMPLV